MSSPVYDDGSEVEVETPVDEPPASGVWNDVEEALHNPTPEEIAEGERLGREIDIDDDEDNGLPPDPGGVS